jgi:subfamily B ATP-binding cassette protein MsbA
MAGFLQERFLGMKIIQSYTNEAITEKAVKGELTEVYSTSVELVRLRSIFRSVAGFFPLGAGIVVLFFGTWLRMNGVLELKELFAFYMALGPIFFVMERSADSSEKISHGVGSLDKVLRYLDAQPAIENKKDAIIPEKFSGEIAFEDVSFRYPGNMPAIVLNKLSFRIQTGKSIALVGSSGSGKTTTADLISRFFDPQEGAIYFDGKDIRDLNVKWLRSQIGVVMQESILFSGTIRENLLIGKPGAKTEEIEKSLEQACALDFVNELPDKLNSIIGERGCTLSGGQQQRLAIARAFLKDPKILILDEATSSLDSETEALVQEALERLMIGRTSIIIAHRLSTVRNVDKIIVLNKGQVKETGTHEELLEQQGIYAMLCEHQLAH